MHATTDRTERLVTFPLVVGLILERLAQSTGPTAVEAARGVFAERGLTVSSAVVAIRPDQTRCLWVPGTGDLVDAGLSDPDDAPAPLQLRFSLPARCATGSLSRFVPDDEDDVPRSFVLRLRASQPVRFGSIDGLMTAQADVSIAAATAVTKLTPKQTDLLGGGDVYLSVAGTSEEGTELMITLTVQ